MEEIDMDTSFKQNEYRGLAERLFGPITWCGMNAIAVVDEMTFELTSNDVSLSITARGPGDTVAFMDKVAALAAQQGIVTVDVQGSEIFLPLSD
jgi:hypothetical protein